MHFQTWNNGKYGRIWPVDDDVYSWKFTEIVNGCASEEDFQNSPVIASHFIGYCINNEPKGEGDIYTPFYTYYYNRCLERYRKKHNDDISLIRDAKRLEKEFLNEHFKEERQAYKDSEVLFKFDESKENYYAKLYHGYMCFLREKEPYLYFVFKEEPAPVAFRWDEYRLISVSGHRDMESHLNQVLDWSLGRIVVPLSFINGGYSPTEEDMEQIKMVYGDSANPFEVYYIYINPTDKKTVAQEVYDSFRQNMEHLQFHSMTERQLVMEHAERWYQSFSEAKEQSFDTEIVKRQLTLCLQTITNENEKDHKPFRARNFIPLDANAKPGLYDCDCHGYPAHPFCRLNDVDFKSLMDAFNKWASARYGNVISNNGKEKVFKPISDGFNAYSYKLYSFMSEQNAKKDKIIENIDYTDFILSISHANLSTMYSVAKANRNQNRFLLIVKHIKTWFPEEWAKKVAASMGETEDRIDKVSPKEIGKYHEKWLDSFEKICPKNDSVQ